MKNIVTISLCFIYTFSFLNVFAEKRDVQDPWQCEELMLQSNVNPSLRAQSLSASLSVAQNFPAPDQGAGKLNQDNFWQYQAYGSSHTHEVFSWIKFIVLLDEEGKFETIYFQNSNSFRFHRDFGLRLDEFKNLDADDFDSVTLQRKGRRALLGTLLLPMHGLLGGELGDPAFELLSHDPLTVTEVKSVQKMLMAAQDETLYEKLVYRPTSEQRAAVRNDLVEYEKAQIEIHFPKAFAGSLVYQDGWTTGRLKKMKASAVSEAMKNGEISASDILLLDQAPREIPRVAGIVISEESSPYSHLALLAQMYSIPFIYEKDAFHSSYWNNLADGQNPVFLRAQVYGGNPASNNIQLRKLAEKDHEVLSNLQRVRAFDLDTDVDASFSTVYELGHINRSVLKTPQVGAKAANLDYFMRSQRKEKAVYNDFKAVALPLSFYQEFLERGGPDSFIDLKAYIKDKLAGIEDQEISVATKSQVLATIRQAILDTEISVELWSKIKQALKRVGLLDAKKLRFRSSSNMEDLPFFNGAGLYSSVGVKTADEAEMRLALKEVWASLYNDRAYFAREYFGLDHGGAAMGVLIHPSFKGELARGVLTMEVDEDGGILAKMLGFPGEDLKVSHPPAGKRPETMLLSKRAGKLITKKQMASTEVPLGQSLLTAGQYEDLFSQLELLKKSLEKSDQPKEKMGLEFEWKLMPQENGSRAIVIKQMRPLPEAVPTNLSGLQDSFLLPDTRVKLRPDYGESEQGLFQLISRFELEFTLNSAFLNSTLLDSEQALLGDIVFTDYEGSTLMLTWTNVQESLSQGSWTKDDYGDQNIEFRKKKILLSFDLPDLSLYGLTLSIEFTEQRDSNTKQILNSLVLLEEANINLSIENQNAFPKLGLLNEGGDTYISGRHADLSYRFSLFDGLRNSKNPPSSLKDFRAPEYLYKEEFKSADQDSKYSVAFVGKTTFSGTAKTRFLDLQSLSLEGFGENTLHCRESKYMLYAPAHHNFSYQYAVDLNCFTDEERSLFPPESRYLRLKAKLANDGIKVEFFNEDLDSLLQLPPLEQTKSEALDGEKSQ